MPLRATHSVLLPDRRVCTHQIALHGEWRLTLSRLTMAVMSERIVVAMSGGVDSSVAAALLKDRGHDVVGISLKLWSYSGGPEAQGCCTPEDMRDARRVAAALDIPFYVLDYREKFRATVIERFCDEYTAGRTPNPCVYCNDEVKFSTLLDEARKLGAERVATGHYARLEESGSGPRLLRSLDDKKDQTYFLFNLRPAQLERAMFPVGGLTKPEVRRHAAALGLATAEKPESQEICFVEGHHYAEVVERFRTGASAFTPGDFVDEAGRVVGEHKGIAHYTVGQRKGIGLAMAEPYYVIRIEPSTNRVVVGPRPATFADGLVARRLNAIVPVGEWEGRLVTAKIRHSPNEYPGRMRRRDEDSVEFRFEEPVAGVSPGQAAVFYDGERVLGGGWIESPL